MSILNDQLKQSTLGLKGATPGVRAGAKPTSQLHAYGNFEKEAQDFQNAQVNATQYKDLTNLEYKLKGEASRLDLDGKTPGIRAGATPTSQLHAYGNFNAEAGAFQDASVFPREIKDLTNVNYRVRGESSQLDLNGVTPSKYSDNLPK